GSGKTWVEGQAECIHYWQWPKVNQGYFAPTYSIIRDIYYPTIEEVAFSMGLNVDVKQGNHEVHFYSGRAFRGTTICRSLDHPQSIVGFKIGRASVDELDTLPIIKAEDCWRKIIARMRYNIAGLKNGIDIGTTPEGFRFCHKLFVQMVQDNPELKNNYGLIQASTYDNEKNLPDDYIPSLKENYPAELIEAYIDGQFVNLTSGTVYRNYDRVRCNSTETIKAKEPLFIGQDFNVQKMASAVFVQRPDGFHAAGELKDVFDTPDVIKIIKERWFSKGHRIIIYPDASGNSRKSVDASKSDIALLTQAGFEVRVNPRNPAVKDRVLATNKAFEQGKVKVNAKACPTIARCLEQQAYDQNGEPDKTTGFDHMNDAFSYPIAYEFPVIKPISRMQIVGT
ncbi:MAG: terminase family protein, partial [Smithella sp.]